MDVPEGPGRAWMLAFQGGDDQAFDRIVLHYQSMVRRFIHRYVQDRDRAEDLSQEVFLRVYRARNRYQPAAGFKTWLFTIVTRLCLNDLRSRRRAGRVIAPLPRGGALSHGNTGEADRGDYLESVADPTAEPPEEALSRKEVAEAIDAAILALPPAQRAAILLLRFEELSYREIAESLGVSLMAVKSLIHRGREGLKEKLGSYLHEERRRSR